MKKMLKAITCTLKKILPNKKDDGLIIYFKTEYKNNPYEAHDYWLNTGRKDYY